MQTPDDMDGFLKDLLKPQAGISLDGSEYNLDREDVEFIDKILKSITNGSKGIFIALHPNDRMQYMLLNTNRLGGLKLLARVIERVAELAEEAP